MISKPAWTDRIQMTKTVFILTALLIAAGSLLYSHKLTRDLYAEEVSNMEVWAQAMRSLTAADEGTDLNLILQVINSNHTIPVVVTDSHDAILTYRNLEPDPHGEDSLQTLGEHARDMRRDGETLRMDLASSPQEPHDYIYISYQESHLLRRLTVYPYVQLGVVGFFFLIAVGALLASKRAEQNRVWVGLSRETAHQLGTPISSLMAWSEVLREQYPNDELLPEMDNDIRRLQLIAERFSKIGSAPELHAQDVRPIVERVVSYYQRRSSARILFSIDPAPEPLFATINAPLFEWVLENLCKNAVDAMDGKGSVRVNLSTTIASRKRSYVRILVTDTGKGIARNHLKNVFRPGFTTKKRGWGLGLSLAKRIVEEYHHGRIYVLESHVGKGTTFAIELLASTK